MCISFWIISREKPLSPQGMTLWDQKNVEQQELLSMFCAHPKMQVLIGEQLELRDKSLNSGTGQITPYK